MQPCVETAPDGVQVVSVRQPRPGTDSANVRLEIRSRVLF